LGSHRKPSRIRLSHLIPTAAVPAVAATAAAVCLAPQALADPAPAHAAAQTATAGYAAGPMVDLISAKQMAARETAAPAQPVKYTVRAGDSLSSIAGRFYHEQNAWPVLYWANRDKIRWANIIGAGQVLKVPAGPAKIPAAPGQLGPAAVAPAPVTSAPVASAASAPAYVPAQSTAPVASSYSGGTPGGSFGQCVVARESGGNAQVMNSSGHYGLYQFAQSTWVAYGGSAADFGHASVAEQNRVFGNALAQGGQSNWSPYDGC
jgi:N-acetylmuramoyl-L-alanine amidase